MDTSNVKKCIMKWVDLDKQIRELDLKRKEFNKQIKEQKSILLEKQQQIKDPILQMMCDIDTETIDINDNLNLKSTPVFKTTGVTKKYMELRIKEYFNGNASTYKVVLSRFVRQYNINIPETDIDAHVNNFVTNEATTLFDFITDITPRKVYFNEEKLTLCQRKRKKN